MTTERQRADEFIAHMKANDPVASMTQEEWNAQKAETQRQLSEAEQPVLAELRAAGVDVDSIWDLISAKEPHDAALPILLRHLQRGGYPPRILEEMGRAMAVRSAIVYWDELVSLYRAATDSEAQEGLAVALRGAADKSKYDVIAELLTDTSLGVSRVLLVAPLLRFDRKRTLTLLPAHIEDPDLTREIQHVLKRAGITKATRPR